jgi:hypothetical protein
VASKAKQVISKAFKRFKQIKSKTLETYAIFFNSHKKALFSGAK